MSRRSCRNGKVGASQCGETLQHQHRAGGEHERGRDLDAGKPPGGRRAPRDLRCAAGRRWLSRTLMRDRAPHRRESEQQRRTVTAVIAAPPRARACRSSTRLTSAGSVSAAERHAASGVSQHGERAVRRPRRASASTRLSARSCRTSRACEAPTARRIAISRVRAVERTSSRLATFAQPISSTNTEPPSSSQSGRRASAKNDAASGAARSVKDVLVCG